MTNVCDYIHSELANRPRYNNANFATAEINNGIYVLFEEGEHAHGVERIVRIGTHTGKNNLIKRINEHFFKKNKDRSVFRKHIGRCLLKRANDPFLAQWDLDLTTKIARETLAHTVDHVRLAQTEASVTDYMVKNFSFVLLSLIEAAERLRAEAALLATINNCPHCSPSENWLGKFHPNPKISRCGLWNIQGIDGHSMTQDEAERII
jgi:hypothetical protein